MIGVVFLKTVRVDTLKSQLSSYVIVSAFTFFNFIALVTLGI